MSTDARETPATTEETIKSVQRQRSEHVRQRDIAAIAGTQNPKGFATNQGVKGYVQREIGRSELATATAMSEVFKQLNDALTAQGQALDTLKTTVENLAKVFQTQHGQAFGRISMLEERWWERLMRDVEWDLYTLRDWVMGLFGWVAEDLEVSVDPDVVDIAPYLPAEVGAATNPVADPAVVGALEFPNTPIIPTDDAEFGEVEWVTCACGHTAEQHKFTQPAPCMIEECGCSDFVAIGSTMPTLVVRR